MALVSSSQLRPNHTQLGLLVAVAACYGLGYPLALVAHSAAGWVLVTLGGVCLIALGVVTIRRVHQSTDDAPTQIPPLPDSVPVERPPD